MGMFDNYNSNPFYPAGGTPLTPAQQQNADTVGLLSAASQLANMSAPHFASQGPAATPLQLLTSGVSAYGSGVAGYGNSINQQNIQAGQGQSAMAKGTMDQLSAQRALNYFYPTGKNDGLAAALASTQMPAGGATAAPAGAAAPTPISPLVSSPVGADPSANVFAPPTPTPSLSTFYGGTPNAATTPAGGTAQITPQADKQAAVQSQATAMGVDVPTMARMMYKQGMDTMMLGQPGGDQLIKQALDIDPTIVRSTAYAQSQGQLPAELTKIGATGDQARQTAGVEAGLRPHDTQVMIDGKLYTVPSNDAAASQGAIPANAAPAGAAVSTAIPAGAKPLAEKQASDLAEAQQTAVNFDARVDQLKANLQDMKAQADKAPAGMGTGLKRDLDNQLANTNVVPFVDGVGKWSGGQAAQAYDKLSVLNSQQFLQEVSSLAKGAGGRMDIPLVNAAHEAAALPMDATPANKKAVIDTLITNLDRVQKNYRNQVNLQSSYQGGNAGIMIDAPAPTPTGWSVTPVK